MEDWEKLLEERRYDEIDLDEIILMVPGYDPHAGSEGYYFDRDAAIDVIAFFCEILTHVKGKWARYNFKLELWQIAFLSNLFGWKSAETGYRRYREALLYVPRKNGKTTMSAGIPLYVLFTDPEPGKEIYVAAGDKDQAKICFEISKQMIKQEWQLASRCNPQVNAVLREDDMSFYKPVSRIAKTKHGYNASVVVIDELHAIEDVNLVEALETGTASRDEPLTIYITTADFDRESICNDKHSYAKGVRDGEIEDPTFLPVIFEADPEKDDWRDEEVWKRVNPNIGISPTWEYMRQKFRKALAEPTFENTFKRLHLDMKTQQDVRCWPITRWDASDPVSPPLSIEQFIEREGLVGAECFGGMDLASTEDVAAFVLFFPAQCAVLPFFWTPEDVAETRERKSRGKYLTWAKRGFMSLCDGEIIDHNDIFELIVGRKKNASGAINPDCLSSRFRIQEIAYDRWNAHGIVTDLMAEGVEMTPMGQGYASMSSPMKLTWDLIRSKQIRHGGNPVLRWMVGNLASEEDPAGNIKPSKKESYEKIDGVVAMIMAIGCAAVGEEEGNVYSERGFVSL